MGADKLYAVVEPAPGVDPDELRAALPTGDFFRWTRIRENAVVLCRHGHDRGIVCRMLDAERTKVTRVAMVEVVDTAASGTGYLYERVGEEFVLVDRTGGGELYGTDVADYFEWRYGIDAGWS